MSGQIREAGSTDTSSMGPSLDGGDAIDVGDVDRPPADAQAEVGGAVANDAREEASTTQPGDARGQDATDATETATGDAGDASRAGDAGGVDPESGRLAGITAAHNAVRAAVKTQPPLPPLVWSQEIADYAQQWATTLATSMCAQPQHRSGADLLAKGYGENLAAFSAGGAPRGGMAGNASTAQQAVNAWAAEIACWTYGTVLGTETCNTACYTNLHSDGCGHYTQVVWRGSTKLGCGVGTCKNGALTEDIWICNYAPAGNIIGRAPY